MGYYEATAYSITAGQNYSFSSMDFGPYGEYWGQTNNQFYRVFKNFGVWDAAPSLLWDATAEPPYAYGNPTPLAGTVFGWCVVNQNPRLGGYNLTALFEGSSGVYVADLLVQGPSAPPAAPPANYGWTG